MSKTFLNTNFYGKMLYDFATSSEKVKAEVDNVKRETISKSWVLDNFLVKSDFRDFELGLTMMGDINMGLNAVNIQTQPLIDTHAVNKKYVDNIKDKLEGQATGDITMGDYRITVNKPPMSDIDVVTKGYVDDIANNKNALDDTNYVLKSEHMKGTATGDIDMKDYKITLSSDPISDFCIVNKKYVEDKTRKALGKYLLKTDHMRGTAAGSITTNYPIISNSMPKIGGHLVNKEYVDKRVDKLTGKATQLHGEATGDIIMGDYTISSSSEPSEGTHLVNKKYMDTSLTDYVLRSDGIHGTVTGDLDTQGYSISSDEPTEDRHLANKKYIDDKSVSLLGSLNDYVRKTEHLSGTATGSIDMQDNFISANFVPINDTHLTNKKYIDEKTQMISNDYLLKSQHLSGTATGSIDMRDNVISASFVPVSNSHLVNKDYVDKRVSVLTQGTTQLHGTATGSIDMADKIISANFVPINDTHLTNKKYVDEKVLDSVSDYLLKSQHLSGTATGSIDMRDNVISASFVPVSNSHLVNKDYVDKTVSVLTQGTTQLHGTATGSIDMGDNVISASFAPVDDTHLTNKKYVDEKTQMISNDYLLKSDHLSGTATGSINMDSYLISMNAPISDKHLTNKKYVDEKVLDSVSDYLLKSDHLSGTATGNIDMKNYLITMNAPTKDGHVANKKYIDDNIVSVTNTINKDVTDTLVNYVPKSEHMKGTATGNIDMKNYLITMNAPVSNKHLTNKKYVDEKIVASVSDYLLKSDHLSGTATGNVNMGNYSIMASSPTKDGHLANKKYIDEKIIKTTNDYVLKSDHLSGTATGNIDMKNYLITMNAPTKDGHLANKKYIDEKIIKTTNGYVPKSEHMKGTATGNIDMQNYLISMNAPVSDKHLTNKKYVDEKILKTTNSYLLKSDHMKGTATGNINMDSYLISMNAPVSDKHLTNKKYVDEKVLDSVSDYLLKSNHLSGTATGSIDMGKNIISADFVPVSNSHLVNKDYVDKRVSVLTQGTTQLHGTATGSIDMGDNVISASFAPINDTHLTNKKYIDEKIVASVSDYVLKSDHLSGTATGSIDMDSYLISMNAPVTDKHLTNKKYVDDNIMSVTNTINKDVTDKLVNYVPKSDHMKGTATGDIDMRNYLITMNAPTNDKHVANKKYVDEKTQMISNDYVLKSDHLSGTATGNIDMQSYSISADPPTNDKHLTNKKYIDDNIMSVTNTINKSVTDTLVNYVPKTKHLSGTATGNIDMQDNFISASFVPTNDTHLANKKYIDDKVTQSNNNNDYLLKSDHLSGTATGSIDMKNYLITMNAPVTNRHLANKEYVDTILYRDHLANLNFTTSYYINDLDIITYDESNGRISSVTSIEGTQATSTGDKRPFIGDQIDKVNGRLPIKFVHEHELVTGIKTDLEGQLDIETVTIVYKNNVGLGHSKYNTTYGGLFGDLTTEWSRYVYFTATGDKDSLVVSGAVNRAVVIGKASRMGITPTIDVLPGADPTLPNKMICLTIQWNHAGGTDASSVFCNATKLLNFTAERGTVNRNPNILLGTIGDAVTDNYRLDGNIYYFSHRKGTAMTDIEIKHVHAVLCSEFNIETQNTQIGVLSKFIVKGENLKGTATGNIDMQSYSISADPPTNDKHLTNKKYVDDKVTQSNNNNDYLLKSDHLSGTATGSIDMKNYSISADAPTNDRHLTNKKYIDDNIMSVTNTINKSVTDTLVNYVPKTKHLSGTATGNIDMDNYLITMNAPVTNRHLANKDYVDTILYTDQLARLNFTTSYYINNLDSVTYDETSKLISSVTSIEGTQATSTGDKRPMIGDETDKINGHLPIKFAHEEHLVTGIKTDLGGQLDIEIVTIVYKNNVAMGHVEYDSTYGGLFGEYKSGASRHAHIAATNEKRSLVVSGANGKLMTIGKSSRLGIGPVTDVLPGADPTEGNKMICLTIQWNHVGGTDASSVFCNTKKLVTFTALPALGMNRSSNILIGTIGEGVNHKFRLDGSIYYFSHKRGTAMTDNEIKHVQRVLCNEFNVETQDAEINLLDRFVMKTKNLQGTATGNIDMDNYLITMNAPVNDTHLTNKKYVDASVKDSRDSINKNITSTVKNYVLKSDHLAGTATGHIDMGNFMITAERPTDERHLASKGYVDNSTNITLNNVTTIVKGHLRNYVPIAYHMSGTASDDINMGSHSITMNAPTSDKHLANKKYVDDKVASSTITLSGAASGDIDMGSHSITADKPKTNRDLVNKQYVDDIVTKTVTNVVYNLLPTIVKSGIETITFTVVYDVSQGRNGIDLDFRSGREVVKIFDKTTPTFHARQNDARLTPYLCEDDERLGLKYYMKFSTGRFILSDIYLYKYATVRDIASVFIVYQRTQSGPYVVELGNALFGCDNKDYSNYDKMACFSSNGDLVIGASSTNFTVVGPSSSVKGVTPIANYKEKADAAKLNTINCLSVHWDIPGGTDASSIYCNGQHLGNFTASDSPGAQDLAIGSLRTTATITFVGNIYYIAIKRGETLTRNQILLKHLSLCDAYSIDHAPIDF